MDGLAPECLGKLAVVEDGAGTLKEMGMIPYTSSLQLSANFWLYSPAFLLDKGNNTSDLSVKLLSACRVGLRFCGRRTVYCAASGAPEHRCVNQNNG